MGYESTPPPPPTGGNNGRGLGEGAGAHHEKAERGGLIHCGAANNRPVNGY